MQSKSCMLCASTKSSVAAKYDAPDQYEIAAGVSDANYHRAWLKCADCGLYYSVFSRGEHDLDRLYQTGYRSKDAPWRKGLSVEETFAKITKLSEAESDTKRKVRWIKDNIQRLQADRLVGRNAPPWDFVDVGGGNGVFAYEFKSDEWKAHICDPSEEGRFIEKHGVHYVQAYFEPGVLKKEFDLISMNCVLEHLRAPLSILKIAKTALSKNGMLFVEVPDALHFDLFPADDDIFNSCHLWMFSPLTMARILFDAGFQVYALTRTRLRKGLGLWALAGHA